MYVYVPLLAYVLSAIPPTTSDTGFLVVLRESYAGCNGLAHREANIFHARLDP